jgi:hypothetical protein
MLATIFILIFILGFGYILAYIAFYGTAILLSPFYLAYKSFWNEDEVEKRENRILLVLVSLLLLTFFFLFLIS